MDERGAWVPWDGLITGEHVWLDWAILAVSLFNAILLLWLGLTVLLTPSGATGALGLAGGRRCCWAGLFFLSHTAILGRGMTYTGAVDGLLVAPGLGAGRGRAAAWYLVMLWYAGFWADRTARATAASAVAARGGGAGRRADRLLALGRSSLACLRQSVTSRGPRWALAYGRRRRAAGGAGYPLYILLCIGLALDALRQPAPSARVMGELARERARPWLIATSLVLLAVSVLVGGASSGLAERPAPIASTA